MMNMLKDIYFHMNSRRRVQLILVLILMLLGGVAEMLTLGSVVPFMGLLVNPSSLDQSSTIATLLGNVATLIGGTKLLAASFIFVIFAVLAAVIRLVLNWASLHYVFAVGADFGGQIYSHSLQQPYLYHIQRNSSEMIAAIDKVTSLVMGIMGPALSMVIAAVMTTAMLAAMLWVDYVTSLCAAAIFGTMYAAISAWSKKRLHDNSSVIAQTGTQKVQAVQEGLGGIRDVIIEGNHHIYAQHFSAADRAQRRAQANNALLTSAPKHIVESAGMIMIVTMAYFLTQSHGAEKSIPILGALAIGAQRLLPYMQSVYNCVGSIRGNTASARDALELLKLVPRPTAAKAMPNLESHANGAVIELRGVNFKYPNAAKTTLNHVDLKIKAGQKVGFVGQTGSGKSTLIDLIMGLLPPSDGELIGYGQVLNDANMQHWQNRIAHVPQAIFLRDKSIAENIALGHERHDIDMARLEHAIEHAQLREFIASLPFGVDTGVGERGVQLSGGQRQRIGIARALYKNADILVLDEATSALDNETEAKVIESIHTLRPNLIVLMIAHRLSTLEKCDRIVELDHGLLKEHANIAAFTQR